MKINININVTIDITADLARQLLQLTSSDVLVGVPAAKAFRPTSTLVPDEDTEINNASLAYIHNYGSPAQNIPARPFLEPGVQDAQPTSVKLLQAAGQAVLSGGSAAAQLEAVGLVNQVAVKKRITSNTPPPLKPATLAARKRRGVTRTNTLVDTGKLLNSISYVVRKK